jgi:glycosyltransferase involved in cell wall biosynthesis
MQEVTRVTAARATEHSATRDRAVELAVILDLAYIGGIEVLFRNLFSRFDPAVVRPRLFCLREGGPLAEEFRATGYPVEVVPGSGPKGVTRLPSLVAAMRRHRVDAVLVAHHHRAALMLGPVAAAIARVPATVIAVQDMDLRSRGRRVLPRWAVESLWLADALVLVAPSQGRYLRTEEGVGRHRWNRVREVVIANGIDVGPIPGSSDRARARATLGIDDAEFVVGSVARLTQQKAHHVLLEAMALLAGREPRCRLVLLGDGDRRDELERIAQGLGIADQVLFAGVRRDVQELLPAFDVSALSSIHEAMPLGVIESMAACLPVVATDCGALRDLVSDGESGYIVPVGDVAGLYDRLSLLAADPALRARLGAAARARAVQHFTIEDTARGYESLLTDLVTARR